MGKMKKTDAVRHCLHDLSQPIKRKGGLLPFDLTISLVYCILYKFYVCVSMYVY